VVVDPLLVECLGGEAAQRAVGSIRVVLDAPVLGEYLHFQQRVELLADEQFVAEAAVERLAGPVLPRWARVDEGRVDAAVAAPVG